MRQVRPVSKGFNNNFHLILCKVIILFVLLNSHLISFAQIEVIHIPKRTDKSNSATNAKQTKTNDVTPLKLPFWDDFSTSTNFPDTSLWLGSQNVSISAGIGINTPSFNVATFDGADVNGNVYSNDPNIVGLADSLLSKPIDLSDVNSIFQNNIYLSFFWQLEGQGEIPDPEDSIRLQFRDINGIWQTVWSMTGGNPDLSDNFQQEFIKVDPLDFLGDNFQFKFESFSRLSGIFDTWQIDYILLNVGRNPANNSHLDRTLTSFPTSLFGKFTAMPASQFHSPSFDINSEISASSVGYLNLENQPQPINFSAIVSDTLTNEPIDTLNFNQFVQPIQAFQRAEFNTDLFDPSKLSSDSKRVLALKLYIDAEDTLLVNTIIGTDTTYTDRFDLKANDTITTYFNVDDYFAYDDGTAEFGAGINQDGGQLAYQYTLFEEDTLTAIDIFFTNIGSDFTGVPLELRVWSQLDGVESSLLVDQSISVKPTIGINKLQSYVIEPALILDGVFYIGYRQSTDQRITMGLDKNTDSGENIFFNVSGQWVQNTEVSGSLMLRPRFGDGAIVTSINDKEPLNDDYKLFPNPSNGLFNIVGEFQEIFMYDITGRQVVPTIQKIDRRQSIVDMSQLPNGIYQLKMIREGKITLERIIIQK